MIEASDGPRPVTEEIKVTLEVTVLIDLVQWRDDYGLETIQDCREDAQTYIDHVLSDRLTTPFDRLAYQVTHVNRID